MDVSELILVEGFLGFIFGSVEFTEKLWRLFVRFEHSRFIWFDASDGLLNLMSHRFAGIKRFGQITDLFRLFVNQKTQFWTFLASFRNLDGTQVPPLSFMIR